MKENGKNVNYINIHDLYNQKWRKISSYSHRFPRKYDNALRQKYLKIINDELLRKYNEEKPAFIFLYNDSKVLLETQQYFKSRGTKVIIFLGDDPNYLFTDKKTFLLNVINADAVIVPDTGWIEGLKMLEVKNIIYSPVGTDPGNFFQLQTNEEQMKKYGSDILFVGTGYYLNSWGIKRAAVLNELCEMKFKIFGDKQWNELFQYFPGLQKHFVCETLSAKEVNIACNCAKIYPVVVNSGVINGVSTRVFDCIASGMFTLSEYKKDFDMLFPEGEVVCFKSKKELKDKVKYFLKNENEMKERMRNARNKVLKSYTLTVLLKNILEKI